MSSRPSIRLSGVGKTFRLHAYPAERIAAFFSARFEGQRLDALSGVDLVANLGDCIGIIGRNGAGKSTLLQIVSGVMAPTTGSVETQGRVAAMLQLGAGFNGEFTGRQNVRLSAAIYGLDAKETEARMASIEAFAGIGEKIDRPVREYSSGMFARLAFAVCAHVDPAILIVDEILGVGDAEFQQRSMGFLRQFRRSGIVLFVSHDEHAVAALCNRVIWIESGRVVQDGPTREVLRHYRRAMAAFAAGSSDLDIRTTGLCPPTSSERPTLAASVPFNPDDLPVSVDGATIKEVSISTAGTQCNTFAGGEHIDVDILAEATTALESLRVLAFLRNPLGQVVFELDTDRFRTDSEQIVGTGDVVTCQFSFRLPFLPSGFYPIDIVVLAGVGDGALVQATRRNAATLRLVSSHVSGGLANMRMASVSFSAVTAGERG